MKPLKSIRVLSLAINLPGPVAAARLRDLGAHIVKVTPPGGDPLAYASPEYYQELTQGVEEITGDLKDPAQRKQCEALLSGADLLLTASRPETLAALELDWPRLHPRLPRLCHVAIIGFPPPRENHPGHDLTYAAALGLLTPAELPRVLVADMAGAEESVSAALALLLARERGQGAGYAQVSLAQAAQRFAGTLRHRLTAPGGLLGGGLPNYAIYPAKTGHVALAALEPRYLQRLLKEFEMTEPDGAAFARIFLTRTAPEWEDWASAQGLPIAALVCE